MEEEHLHLKYSIRCFTFIGFWPRKFNNKLFNNLYKLHFKFTLTLYFLTIISELIEMYTIILERDLEKFTSLMGNLFFHVMGLQKLAASSGKLAKKLIRRVYVTERNILKNDNGKVKKIYMEYVEKNHSVNTILLNVSIVCGFCFISMPYVSDLLNRPDPLYEVYENGTVIYKQRFLPLSTWFPFDRYKYYGICYAYHVLILTFYPSCVAGVSTFFYGLIIFAVGQIKILQETLKSFADEEHDGSKDERRDRVRKCVFYHRAIIDYVSELSGAMETFLLTDFVSYGFQIAIIGFQAAVMDISPNLIVTVVYLGTMIMQLFLFYWYANEVLLESLNVSKSIWNSNWYVCDKNTKQMLSLIMLRSQKPLVLSVGPFYYMSTDTLIAILRVAYSYAMLMHRLYSK